jgi:hypothetical protein
MNLILFDIEGNPADLDDLRYWATELGLEFPVLSDPEGRTGAWYGTAFQGWTTGVLINRGMVLHTVGAASIEDAVALME